jgi:hypothetical protein
MACVKADVLAMFTILETATLEEKRPPLRKSGRRYRNCPGNGLHLDGGGTVMADQQTL